ncbi:MAG: hypothetical protein GC166_00605 [Alphaproteobacteria bacterium]|nr:hypothetical protein [Alphaproteobacteria bacterium]
MADPHAAAPARDDQNRTMTIIIYGLLLAALFNGITAVVAVILAYVKRDDMRGTIYEGHLSNAIEIFWTALVVGVLGCVTIPLAIGIFILAGLYIWFIYRSVKGLVRAIDARPYH